MKELDELIDVFSRITDKAKMAMLFEELFTPAERETLRLRWILLKMLKDGTPQREISSSLGISLCKITRGSKLLKNSESVLNEIFNELKKEN